MADSDSLVEATITAQNTWTDDLIIPASTGLKEFMVEVKGSSTFSDSTAVTIQVKAEDDADAEYTDAGQIEPADEDWALVGVCAGGTRVRAGIKTGEYGGSDSVKIRLRRV